MRAKRKVSEMGDVIAQQNKAAQAQAQKKKEAKEVCAVVESFLMSPLRIPCRVILRVHAAYTLVSHSAGQGCRCRQEGLNAWCTQPCHATSFENCCLASNHTNTHPTAGFIERKPVLQRQRCQWVLLDIITTAHHEQSNYCLWSREPTAAP